jgi:hypothetical protein
MAHGGGRRRRQCGVSAGAEHPCGSDDDLVVSDVAEGLSDVPVVTELVTDLRAGRDCPGPEAVRAIGVDLQNRGAATDRERRDDAEVGKLASDMDDRVSTPAATRAARALEHSAPGLSSLYPFVRPALVNGAAGAVVAPRGRLFSVVAFTVTNGKITQINALLDPDRLARLDLSPRRIEDKRP